MIQDQRSQIQLALDDEERMKYFQESQGWRWYFLPIISSFTVRVPYPTVLHFQLAIERGRHRPFVKWFANRLLAISFAGTLDNIRGSLARIEYWAKKEDYVGVMGEIEIIEMKAAKLRKIVSERHTKREQS